MEFAKEEEIAEGITEGIKLGIAESKAEIALKMLWHGVDEKSIMLFTDLSLADLQALRQQMAKQLKKQPPAVRHIWRIAGGCFFHSIKSQAMTGRPYLGGLVSM